MGVNPLDEQSKHLFSVTQNHREAPFMEQAGQLKKI